LLFRVRRSFHINADQSYGGLLGVPGSGVALRSPASRLYVLK
jgi:hypothetical protein